MKVVLFCGGFGMRLREYSESIPKPMVPIGYRPILWHVMKYYAHFGHKDFILCLGWKADVIKRYFLNYDECLSNDFLLSGGGKAIALHNSDIHDWNITFCDTGAKACVGERLRAVRRHLAGEREFLVNYTDSLTDLPLPQLLDFHRRHDAIASFVSVRPRQSFHEVEMEDNGRVAEVRSITESDVWMNGGYFVMRQEIFDYLEEGEELVHEPFSRLIQEGRLYGMKYDGFFGCMDTYKEKQMLDDRYEQGDTPWELWKTPRNDEAAAPSIYQHPQTSLRLKAV